MMTSADAPEIYMQQFRFIVTKIQKTNFYEFKLANKKCQFDVEVFLKALDICPRVQRKEFIEDFSYQIDNGQLKKSRHEIMPYPKFTKVIINHFLAIHKSVPKALPSGLYTIKDDGVLSRTKFVRIGEEA
ncbi:hypothetical protein Tco_0593520 [Tanacetum coccineum]